MGPTSGNYDRAETFRASDAPQLVIDTGLVIRDVNPACLKVTARTYDELLGTPVFEAFPDNPDDPQAADAASVSASFERVFRGVRRDQMPLHRYDIPSSDAPGGFVRRFWISVSTRLEDESGHLFGALRHVEDVTTIVESILRGRPSAPAGWNMKEQAWNSLVTALVREALGHQQARMTAEQLQHALTSRIVIEQAKGVIAAREGVTVDEAFARLRRHARRHNANIHEAARAVVELGLLV